MTRFRILTVLGTRPEAIKMSPVIKQLESNNYFESTLLSTGQHAEMLSGALDFFSLKPDIDLQIMRKGQSLEELTSRILRGVGEVIENIKPDMLLVHGDTTTAFASALAAFYKQVDVGHIEAGLRTGNVLTPFPEEFNRQAISRVAKLHFAPTVEAETNLKREGISSDAIYVTGNTIVDALMRARGIVEDNTSYGNLLKTELIEKLNFDLDHEKFILVTSHRRENFGRGLLSICEAISSLSEEFGNIHFVFPVHLNPAVKSLVEHKLSRLKNVHLTSPLDYGQFIMLLCRAVAVLTDSGGIQEEAPSFGVPVLVMRDTTERPEAVNAGVARLVGSDKSSIIANVRDVLMSNSGLSSFRSCVNPFGDGKSASRILSALVQYLSAIKSRAIEKPLEVD